MASAIVNSRTPQAERDRWRTPRETFEYASRRYGPFDLDAAADETNHLCGLWLGPGSEIAEDALAAEWGPVSSATMPERPVRAYGNPPYSITAKFVAKAWAESVAGRAQTTLLLPATCDVRWFHEYAWSDLGPRPGVLVEFLPRRVRFLRPDGTPAGSPTFGSVLVTFLAKR
jgi:phage N-6-adenine-methyltransferase